MNSDKQTIYFKKRNVIYKIINIVNNKFYIGSASYYDKRIGTHVSLLRKKEHENPYLQSAWIKYGEESFIFEILEEVELKESLLNREQYWLDITKCYNRKIGYNICKNAYSSIGVTRSEEFKKKVGDFWRGKKFSKERIESLKKRTTLLQGKAIIVYDSKFNFLYEFDSISETSRQLGISIACISKQCSELKGLIKPRKYIFRYKIDNNIKINESN